MMDTSTLPKDKQIIIFDGVCNLCDSIVNYVIRHDRHDAFRFVSLQSDLGKQLVDHIGVKPQIDSIVLYNPGVAYYIKSDAALEIAKQLGWRFALIFGFIPKFLRDALYDYIARNR